jgi:TolB-like protein/class 3 adenylate cyclase/tetratricopeptide (TPR) repeat protein
MERRLAAVMIADVVGYGRLSQIDEEGTRARFQVDLKEVFEPKIATYHGRLVKTMGDGLLVEFPSVVDALRCAVEAQQDKAKRNGAALAEQRLEFRVGVNLGDVIVEGDDIHGDGVNIADRIQALAEPGGIAISGTAYDQVKAKLPVGYASLGEQKVKSITEPVRVYRVLTDPASVGKTVGTWTHLRSWRVPAAAAAFLSLAIIVAAAWWLRPVELASAKPSIAVLPFDNLGGDEQTGRLADGITEDIITDLSRFRDLSVIARNSTMAYKGKSVDVREVGRELNVSYVLEGSVQRQGDRIRTTAQLIDAPSGAHVWSDRWDRPAEDIFAVQTEISETVVATLGGTLNFGVITKAEVQRTRRRAPSNLTAYEHFLLAAEAKGQPSKEGLQRGLEHADKAIALDPTFARAYTVRGWLNMYSAAGFGADWNTTLERIGSDWSRAVELDPMDGEARVAHGAYLAMKGRLPEAAVELHHAIELAPMHAQVLRAASAHMPYLGEIKEGVALADRAIRLDPRLPPGNKNGLIEAYFYAHRFDRVIEVATSMPEEMRLKWTVLHLAMSYAYLGRTDEARATKAAYVERFGAMPAEQWLNEGQYYARQQEQDLFVDGFRKLGLPICATDEFLTKIANPKRLSECVVIGPQ